MGAADAVLYPPLRTGLANAVAATALAAGAWPRGRLARRPAAAHALWVLALVKLLTPPLWSVPLPIAGPAASTASAAADPPTTDARRQSVDAGAADLPSTGEPDATQGPWPAGRVDERFDRDD